MVYDSTRGYSVLFGGVGFPTTFGDTWEWDGTSWAERPVSGPAPRYALAMAYDSRRQATVLFGGGHSSVAGQTWEWDGTNWTERQVSGPEPRGHHVLAFDSARGVTVLFGGFSFVSGDEINDTWEYDGLEWIKRLPPGPVPSPRIEPGMAFDAARGVTVLFGGAGPAPTTYHDDTWEWDGAHWTQLQVSGPAGRSAHTLSYDPIRRAVVLFGGDGGGAGGTFGDTWELQLACYPNCDGSAVSPALNVADFSCFLRRFAAGEEYANCDNSTGSPALTPADFTCFLQKFADGCPP